MSWLGDAGRLKLVIHPALDTARLRAIEVVAGPMHVVNAGDPDSARREIETAQAFFGKLTPELLAAAKQLRWVQSPTASLEHYLFPALVEHPLTLTNMRGIYGDVIAEHVLGMMLSFTRNLHVYLRQQLAECWEPIGGEDQRVSFATGPGVLNTIDQAHRSLGDLTVGIVGLGQIGQEIAKRLGSFGTKVLAVDPQVSLLARDSGLPEGVVNIFPPVLLAEVLAVCDFVVIAAPHTPQTEQFFRREQFQTMRRTAVLINVGRGAIVNLNDLVDALAAGEIAGAGLDVFEIEPLPAGHPLWQMPNVILTPHVAAQSVRVPPRHLAALLNNVQNFVAGKPLVNVVDKRLWY